MARKTNKTAHVLNLLASGTSKSSEPEPSEQPSKSSLAPNISIVDNPTSANDPLAGLIKDSLDKEISMLADKSKDEPEAALEVEETVTEPIEEPVAELAVKPVTELAAEPAVKPVTELAAEPAVKPVAELAAESIADPVIESAADIAAPPKVEVEAAPVTPDISVAAFTPAAEPAPAPPAPAPAPLAPAPALPPAPAPEPQFRYINMMEVLLDERHLEFMRRFDTCTCERCTLDVKALAMSNLPPKYLVSPIASIAPLTSFYRNKYNLYVVTELTKACLAIINDPRH